MALSAALALVLAAGLPPELSLTSGEQKVLEVPGVVRVAIGDAAIADLKTIGSNQLLLIGGDEGQTTLLVWLTDGKRLSSVISVKGRKAKPAPAEAPPSALQVGGVELRAGSGVALSLTGLTAAKPRDAKLVEATVPQTNQLMLSAKAAGKTVVDVTAGGKTFGLEVTVTAP